MSTSDLRMVNIALLCMSIMIDAVLLLGMSRVSSTQKRKLLLAAMWAHLAAMTGELTANCLAGRPGELAHWAIAGGAFVAFAFANITSLAIMNYIYTDASGTADRNAQVGFQVFSILACSAIGFAVLFTNPWTHAYFMVTPDNFFQGGPLVSLFDILFVAQWLLMFPMVFRLRHRHKAITTARLLVCVSIIISASVVMMMYRRFALMPVSLNLVMVLLCVGVQTRLEESLAEARAEAAESRMRLLSGQIHPHFIFNSLNAIKALVTENPVLAEQTIQDFADYLRSHLDEMSSSRLVSFEQEMNHVRHYVSLEMADLDRPLHMVYDLQATNFMVPPLTVQPLVENAIRHGIRTRVEGGQVTVATRETDKAVLVIVSDDGHGISSATLRQDQRRQVGLENVRERLERQCGGTLEVDCNVKGTVATMVIPRSDV